MESNNTSKTIEEINKMCREAGLPEVGTPEFNLLCSAYFGGQPIQEHKEKEDDSHYFTRDANGFVELHESIPSKEEKVVSETVEESFRRHIETVYGRPSEYNRMYGHHLRTFGDGAKWQKEQDKKLVNSLINLMKRRSKIAMAWLDSDTEDVIKEAYDFCELDYAAEPKF